MRTQTELRPTRPVAARRPLPVADPPHRGRRWRWLLAAVLAPLVLAVGGLWYFVLRRDAPPVATLDQAVAGVQASANGAVASTVDGTWTIDGTITNTQGTGSYTGFRVNEVLSGVGSTTAVGRTPSLEGKFTVDGSTLTAATVTADLTAITSNDSRRDNAIQQALATSRYPTATFVLTTPVDVGAVPAEGQPIDIAATGDLTIHGVTRAVTIPLQAQLQNGVLVVVGTTEVSFADYGVTAPSAPIVASVENHATVELQLYLTKS
jgi:polyisoprenoid-binding protein YceI